MTLPPKHEKADFVKRGFNEIAKRYDLLNDVMTLGLHRHWKSEVIRLLNLQSGMKILDLCSGTGDLAFRASSLLDTEGSIVALDFALDMMAEGKKRAEVMREKDSPPILWLCADAGFLPFPSLTFDGAMVGFGLRNVTNLEKTLCEVFRVLKPDASFVSLDTALPEWKALHPFYHIYMKQVVPCLGATLARSRQMYSYLTASAESFLPPQELAELFKTCGFIETGFAYKPPILGGAALVWGKRSK